MDLLLGYLYLYTHILHGPIDIFGLITGALTKVDLLLGSSKGPGYLVPEDPFPGWDELRYRRIRGRENKRAANALR